MKRGAKAKPADDRSLTQKKLERLFEYHTRAAASLGFTLELLRAEDHRVKMGRAPDILVAALSEEATRKLALEPPPTSEPEADEPRRKSRPGSQAKLPLKQRRLRSAAWLAEFDPVIPKQANETSAGRDAGLKGLGTFVRRNYLKRKGNGYVRTAKVFVP